MIANQKVFDYQELFRQHGILVLPRIGTAGMTQLKAMTKCQRIVSSVGDLMLAKANDVICIVDKLELMTSTAAGSRTYLNLRKEDSNECTLVIRKY